MNQIKDTVLKYNLFNDSDKIVVGLSGGADSVALCHFLKFNMNMNVVACHINHNLRGDESIRDMEFVKNLCNSWNVPLYIKSEYVDTFATENKLSLEEAGRKIRYSFFEQIRAQTDSNYIATAHTLSDNIETLLFNITRGTGVKGLCGIPIKRENIIRPMLFLTREDIENYCNENKLEYVTDSTNLTTDYSRNKIRHNVVPILKEINPMLHKNITKMFDIINIENSYIENEASTVYNNIYKNNVYNVEVLKQCDKAIRLRVISKMLDEYNIAKSYDTINEIDRIIFLPSSRLTLTSQKYVEVRSNKLRFIVNTEYCDCFFDSSFSKEIEFGENIVILDEAYDIILTTSQNFEKLKKVYKNLLYIAIDYDKIKGKLVARLRNSSDKICLANSNCTKSLKKLFIEKKLSNYEKSKTIVLADDDCVCAVYSIGVDEKYKITADTKNIMFMVKKEMI